ncbi:MAG: hypothetical protein M1823_001656 [Watsoniomyces obsoletus]|nr:MAG: hypothetical protein M1823_001656 [Watsoniomyces obsoletus]
MSATAQPISTTAFAEAIQDLPVGSLHSKAAELQNSINHLRDSNEQLRPFSLDGDQSCTEAISENKEVIERMQERIRLLRAEVERRGMRWTHDTEDEKDDSKLHLDDDMEAMDVDAVDGDRERMRGIVNGRDEGGAVRSGQPGANGRGERAQNGSTGIIDGEGVHL